MSSTTTHLGLIKPAGADPVTIFRTGMGSNADTLDAVAGRLSGGLQEGVIDAGAFEVTQDTGSNMNVKVASHVGTGAYVQDDGVTGQGLYYVVTTGGVTTVAIGAAHATLPRVDRVVVGLDGTVAVVAGTATSGATLDNLTGAAGVPASKLLLADVHIPATDTSISNSQIRDRRKWARGAYRKIARNANAAAGSDYTIAGSTTLAYLDSTNVLPRIECSGVPVRATLIGEFSCAASTPHLYWSWQVDGAGVNGLANVSVSAVTQVMRDHLPTAAGAYTRAHVMEFTPTAGSHLIGPAFASSSSAITLYANTNHPCMWIVEEILRQDTANNTTTTG